MLAAVVALAMVPNLDVRYQSGTGLFVSANGIPIVQGSWFQYFEPGWIKGYSSSRWETQDITPTATGFKVKFVGRDPRATGEIDIFAETNRVRMRTTFRWDGPNPVAVEFCPGMLWQPAFQNGTVEGKPLPKVAVKGNDIGPRRLAQDRKTWNFAALWGKTQLASSTDLTAFDARGYGQDWAEEAPRIWLGTAEIRVTRDKPVTLDFDWTFQLNPVPKTDRTKTIPLQSTSGVVETPLSDPVREFQRGTGSLDEKALFKVQWSRTNLDAISPGIGSLVLARFQDSTQHQPAEPPLQFTSVENGYRLLMEPKRVEIASSSAEMRRAALSHLGMLIRQDEKGRRWLPTGSITAKPDVDWRGAHLFVGPTAVEFQSKLWDRYMLPLGFNQVVLQCEQTAWDAIPGTETRITMPKAKLQQLFSMYRDRGIEPVPPYPKLWTHGMDVCQSQEPRTCLQSRCPLQP
jgi:hypothetical protein